MAEKHKNCKFVKILIKATVPTEENTNAGNLAIFRISPKKENRELPKQGNKQGGRGGEDDQFFVRFAP